MSKSFSICLTIVVGLALLAFWALPTSAQTFTNLPTIVQGTIHYVNSPAQALASVSSVTASDVVATVSVSNANLRAIQIVHSAGAGAGTVTVGFASNMTTLTGCASFGSGGSITFGGAAFPLCPTNTIYAIGAAGTTNVLTVIKYQ